MAGSLNQMASGLSVCDFAGPVLLLRAKTLFAEATRAPMAGSDMPSDRGTQVDTKRFWDSERLIDHRHAYLTC